MIVTLNDEQKSLTLKLGFSVVTYFCKRNNLKVMKNTFWFNEKALFIFLFTFFPFRNKFTLIKKDLNQLQTW